MKKEVKLIPAFDQDEGSTFTHDVIQEQSEPLTDVSCNCQPTHCDCE